MPNVILCLGVHLLPSIAAYFRVSIDELLCVDISSMITNPETEILKNTGIDISDNPLAEAKHSSSQKNFNVQFICSVLTQAPSILSCCFAFLKNSSMVQRLKYSFTTFNPSQHHVKTSTRLLSNTCPSSSQDHNCIHRYSHTRIPLQIKNVTQPQPF